MIQLGLYLASYHCGHSICFPISFFFFFNEERVHERESGQGSTVKVVL